MTTNKKPTEYGPVLNETILPLPSVSVTNEMKKTGANSLTFLIKNKCLDCGEGTKKDIRNCERNNCPLWHHRPWKKDKKLKPEPVVYGKKQLNPTERAKASPNSKRAAINAYCYWCAGEKKKDVTLCPSSGCPLHDSRPYQQKNKQG